MRYNEAFSLVKEANISESENDLCFQAAVILFVGIDSDWNLDEVHKATGYDYDNCSKIISNYLDNGIIKNGKICMDIGENELENVIELTLIAMCGAGEIFRHEEKIKQISKTMAAKKTLNEHLFDTLDRLSDATEDNIKVEVEKACNIVMVSEQILNVAKLKMEIIQSKSELTQFGEIDKLPNSKEDDNSDKKKLPA